MENEVSDFQQLNRGLQQLDRALPYTIIDLDRLDQNIDLLKGQLAGNTEIRLVAKSLPSQALLTYLMERLDTRQLMVFHQPFLLQLVKEITEPLDILLGKPTLVTSAQHFYQNANGDLHRIQWLIDTPER